MPQSAFNYYVAQNLDLAGFDVDLDRHDVCGVRMSHGWGLIVGCCLQSSLFAFRKVARRDKNAISLMGTSAAPSAFRRTMLSASSRFLSGTSAKCEATLTIFSRTLPDAMDTDPPPVTALRLPQVPQPYGTIVVSPSITFTSLSGTPSSFPAT